MHRVALAVLLCASACDRLLELTAIPPLADAASGGDGGGPGDDGGDAGPHACAPTTTQFKSAYTMQLDEAAVTEQANYEACAYAGDIVFSMPIGNGIGVVIAASATHPAVTRDGSELFVATSSGVSELTYSGTDFTLPASIAALAGTAPGSPATLSSGDLAMVVASTSAATFQEWRRAAGTQTWTRSAPRSIQKGPAASHIRA